MLHRFMSYLSNAGRRSLTIDQLAAATGTTSRRIRSYQTLGLLPHPELRGRTGLYGDDHVEPGVRHPAAPRTRLLARVAGRAVRRARGGPLAGRRARRGRPGPAGPPGVTTPSSTGSASWRRGGRRVPRSGRPAALHRSHDDVGRERGLLTSGRARVAAPPAVGGRTSNYGVAVAVTTRHGGVSPAPYDTLNLGLHVGDDPARVQTNRTRAAAAFGVDLEAMVYARQVHGTAAVVVGARRCRARHAPGGRRRRRRPTSSSPDRPR